MDAPALAVTPMQPARARAICGATRARISLRSSGLNARMHHDAATQVMNVASWAIPLLTTGVNVLVVPGFTPPSAAQPFTNWVARNGISKAIVGRCQTRLLQAVVRGSIEPVSLDLVNDSID